MKFYTEAGMERNIGGAVLRRTVPIEAFKLEKRLKVLFSNRLTVSQNENRKAN